MSGLDALQAATSAFAVAELARQTALLLKKVYKAHKEAEVLYHKTQSLSKLVENVGGILRQRHEQPGYQSRAMDDQATLQEINTALNLCRKCIQAMRNQFEALRAPEGSRRRVRARIKLVYRQEFIASQERDINMHVSVLSTLLLCLLHRDNVDHRIYEAEERQRRAQFSQNQQDMQEAFLRDLFALFQYIARCAAASAAAGDPRAYASGAARAETAASTVLNENNIGPRDVPAIENVDAQTLDELFGRPVNRAYPLENFTLPTTSRIEELSDEEIDLAFVDSRRNGRAEHEAVYTSDDDEDDDISRTSSENMTQYASETTLLLAIKRGDTHLVSSLINEGADPSTKDSYDWTVLHHAVFGLHVKVVDVLLEHLACREPQNLNAQTKTGETALIFAVQRINQKPGYDIAMKLLEHDCDANISDGKGSALYYAVTQGRPTNGPRQSIVRCLAERGADVSEVNRQIPDNVSDYPVLSRFISTIDERGDNDSNAQRSGSVADSTKRRKSSTRKDSTTSPRRPTFSRIFMSRTRSSSGAGSGSGLFGSTPP